MNLRAKLLLSIGLLLLGMAGAMYFIPSYLIKEDVFEVEGEIRGLIAQDHQELIENQENWLRQAIKNLRENLNAILLVIHAEDKFSASLSFSDTSAASAWGSAANLSSYDPQIGFVQAHAPGNGKAAVVIPEGASLIPIQHMVKRGAVTWILTRHSAAEPLEDHLYLGVPLPEALQSEKGARLYALVYWEDQIKKVEEEIEEVKLELQKEEKIDIRQFSQDQDEEIEAWAKKIDLLEILAPLYAKGLPLNGSEEIIPAGVARVYENLEGEVLLSRDVFQEELLFDDAAYFNAHAPPQNSPPLAEGFALALGGTPRQLFLANTLAVDGSFLSVGMSLNHLIQRLALASNQAIILQHGSVWYGFDRSGNPLTVDTPLKKQLEKGSRDEFVLKGMPFTFSIIKSSEDFDLKIYVLHSLERLSQIRNSLRTLETSLSEKISLQVFLVFLGGTALILFFLARMSLRVIRPVMEMADATKEIVAGHYQEVKLPDVGNRKDEIATLAHSFSEMVTGLQERETIRGVLNKVVSKDIADEILRSKIQLGGEDRVVTILFSDIRGFTQLTENFPPQKTIAMLNACMTKMSRIIESEGGVIDKYVGDEIMAVYGAPTTHPDHALRAVSSGMLMVETLKKWNEERKKMNEPPIEMGIGIHTGIVVAGNMGAEDRLNYTVLGANVNLAARLCSAAPPSTIIISESTLHEANIEQSFYVKSLPPITLKGFSDPVSIYQVTGFKWNEI